MAIGHEIPPKLLNWPDTVIFGRTYHPDAKPIDCMRKFKAEGKRILYDIDDDFWTVNEDNPSVTVSSAYKDQYETFIRECDAVITPSNVLKKKIRRLEKKKEVFICPNGVSDNYYHERPHEHEETIIGYAGASSHWGDLELVPDILRELRRRGHRFVFTMFGMVSGPLEGEMYAYDQIVKRNLQPEREEYFKRALSWYSKIRELNIYHIPFYPPELYPSVLAKADFDIAIAPLADNEFNRAKSAVKFYEYVASGSVVLASNVTPYREEVNYTAKNTTKDWVKKLEKLLVDEKFRDKIYREQRNYVMNERTTDANALAWEIACQRPGGLKVKRQKK